MSSELNSKVSFRTLPGLFSSASVRALWGWALKGLGLRVGNRVGLLLGFCFSSCILGLDLKRTWALRSASALDVCVRFQPLTSESTLESFMI